MSLKVSVIIPFYNAEKHFDQCIETVLKQTLIETEFIFIDDGSNDRSLEILKKYKDNSDRIKVLSQKNMYAGTARNKGLFLAQGKYIVFLDADDFFEESLLENAYEEAEANATDISIFQFKLYYDKRKKVGKKSWGIHSSIDKVFSIDDVKKKKFSFTNIAVWNKIYRRSFLSENNIFFEDLRSLNDVGFSWQAILKAKRISFLRKSLLYYRIESGKSITDLGVLRTKDHFRAFTNIEKHLIDDSRWEIIKYDFKITQIDQFYSFIKNILKNYNNENAKLINQYISDTKSYLIKSMEDFDGDFWDMINDYPNYKFILAAETCD